MSEAPITQYLNGWNEGDPESPGRVVAGLYDQLHRMAAQLIRSERPGHLLQPTALVHELYLRLNAAQLPDWQSRTHFFAVASGTLRRILIDHARSQGAKRRGGDAIREPLDTNGLKVDCSYDDLLIIDEALGELEKADARAARVTELRFFGGLTENEIAAELGLSEITVKRDWKFARAYLAARLSLPAGHSG